MNGQIQQRQIHLGLKSYELSNHLGNVLATVSDAKIAVEESGSFSHFAPEVVSATDYYPFGLAMEGRTFSGEGYRWGFNGKEDDPAFGSGIQDYGLRIYDKKVARFLSIDPLSPEFPWYTPYQFAGLKPIWAIDLDGAEELISTLWVVQNGVATRVENAETGNPIQTATYNHAWDGSRYVNAYHVQLANGDWKYYSSDQKYGAEQQIAKDGISIDEMRFTGLNAVEVLNFVYTSTNDVIHGMLDGAGNVPFVGEAADLANAALYLAELDVENSATSLASTIPFLGTIAQIKKHSKVLGKVVGGRGKLRKALGIAKGSDYRAQHVIPVELLGNKHVRDAIDQGFDFNGAANVAKVEKWRHLGSHPSYSRSVNKLIDREFAKPENAGRNAKDLLQEITDSIKDDINSNPKKKINKLYSK